MSQKPRKLNQRSDRTTAEQLQCYVKYCKENPDLVRYQTDSNYKNAPLQVKELWEKLTNELNGMRGPTRSLKRWKDSLTQWRKQARFRMRKLRRAKGQKAVADTPNTPYKDIMVYDEQILEESINARSKKSENPTHKVEPEDDVEFTFDSVYVADNKVDRSSTQSSPLLAPISHNGTTHLAMTESHSDCSFIDENEHVENKATHFSQREKARTWREEEDPECHKTVKILPRQRRHSENSDAAQNENLAGICKKLVKSLQEREQRDERLFTQQQSVIAKLDQTLLLMTQVLVKLNDKLDKL